jgi:hypothetical protein
MVDDLAEAFGRFAGHDQCSLFAGRLKSRLASVPKIYAALPAFATRSPLKARLQYLPGYCDDARSFRSGWQFTASLQAACACPSPDTLFQDRSVRSLGCGFSAGTTGNRSIASSSKLTSLAPRYLDSTKLRNCTNGRQTAWQSTHSVPRREIEHVEGNFGIPENGPRRTSK